MIRSTLFAASSAILMAVNPALAGGESLTAAPAKSAIYAGYTPTQIRVLAKADAALVQDVVLARYAGYTPTQISVLKKAEIIARAHAAVASAPVQPTYAGYTPTQAKVLAGAN